LLTHLFITLQVGCTARRTYNGGGYGRGAQINGDATMQDALKCPTDSTRSHCDVGAHQRHTLVFLHFAGNHT